MNAQQIEMSPLDEVIGWHRAQVELGDPQFRDLHERIVSLLAALAAPKEAGGEYSQGVCGDGAAILRNGLPMTVDEIVAELNATTSVDQRQEGSSMGLHGCLSNTNPAGSDSTVAGSIPATDPPSTASPPEAAAVDVALELRRLAVAIGSPSLARRTRADEERWSAKLEELAAAVTPAPSVLYDELIYAVASKYPGESRHETALRYITERETARFAELLAPAGVPAVDGEAVAWRYLKHLGGEAYAWTRWLGMDELHHYGANDDLVKGPAPEWKVEYAYSASMVVDADEYEFEIWQGDECQAKGSAESPVSIAAEAAHYAVMYGQDGPVEVRYYARRAIDVDAALTTSSAQSAGGLDGR